MQNQNIKRELYRCGDMRISIDDAGTFALWRGDAIIERGMDWRPISSVFFATAEMRANRRFAEEARRASAQRGAVQADDRAVCTTKSI